MTTAGRRNDVHARSRAIDALSHDPSNLKARADQRRNEQLNLGVFQQYSLLAVLRTK